MYFWIFLFFIMAQRLAELVYANRNRKIMLSRGAKEYDINGYKYIVLMHTVFFISLITEKILLLKGINLYWYIFLIIFICGQVLRYSAILTLREYWNTRIIILKGSKIIRKGPYRYLNHPNYFGVVLEIIAIPLVFSCYITASIFTILNIIILKRRIAMEEIALEAASNGN